MRNPKAQLLACLAAVILNNIPGSQCDLYNSTDPLVLLNSTNFYKTFLGKPNAWIIEFYSSWCGHCINFAPTWRAFSYQVMDWDHTIKAAVLDCSDNENVPICREYEVRSYPTIRLFPPYVQKGDLGMQLVKRGIDDLQDSMALFILQLQELGKSGEGWVNLSKYEGPIEEIFTEAPPEAKYGVIIVEDQYSLDGSRTILDLGNYRMIYVRSMWNESPFLDTVDLPSLPAVIVVNREGLKAEVMRTDVTTREEMTALIIQHLNLKRRKVDPNYGVELEPEADLEEENSTTNIQPTKEAKPQVYMVDIENTLSYALNHEVSLTKLISGEQLEALVNFTEILVKYLPARAPVHNFLTNLNIYVNSFDTLTGEGFQKALEAMQSSDSLLPEQKSWKGCLGSDPKFRGYPCGLWTLFHTLTVNAAIQEANNSIYEPLDVMRAIHGYVKNFFGCRHCSKHFQAMYAEDAETFVQNAGDEMEWFWKSHNKVNVRLKDDLSSDPQYPKVVFPTKTMCPQCRKRGGAFNVPEVMEYLKDLYTVPGISMEGTESLPGFLSAQNVGINVIANSFMYVMSGVSYVVSYFFKSD